MYRLFLERLLFAHQRWRSIVREQNSDLPDQMLGEMFPWVFGPKQAIKAITTILERPDIPVVDVYNQVVILHKFTPEVLAYLEIILQNSDIEIPRPETLLQEALRIDQPTTTEEKP
jgi:hypothetical protein